MKRDITTGPQTLATIGPFAGFLDTSEISGDYTITLTLEGITPQTTARVAIEDFTNLSLGTLEAPLVPNNLPVAVWHFAGPGPITGDNAPATDAQSPATQSLRRYQLPDTRTGVAYSGLRATLLAITTPQGVTPSITVHATLDN